MAEISEIKLREISSSESPLQVKVGNFFLNRLYNILAISHWSPYSNY